MCKGDLWTVISLLNVNIFEVVISLVQLWFCQGMGGILECGGVGGEGPFCMTAAVAALRKQRTGGQGSFRPGSGLVFITVP